MDAVKEDHHVHHVHIHSDCLDWRLLRAILGNEQIARNMQCAMSNNNYRVIAATCQVLCSLPQWRDP